MNKNIIIIITTIAITLSIVAIILAVFTMQSHHNTMMGSMNHNERSSQGAEQQSPMNQMPCHQMPDGSWMGNCQNHHTQIQQGNHMDHIGMDHSHMNHEVSSELEFIVEMIPHHQEAVDSSIQLLELGTNNQELEQLLNEIIETQNQEISMMQNWLQNWYFQENHEASYQEMMPDLSQLPENQRDEAYIIGMIMHHEMAIIMAQSVLEIEDIRGEVRELAQEIIRVQEEEIQFMNSLLQ